MKFLGTRLREGEQSNFAWTMPVCEYKNKRASFTGRYKKTTKKTAFAFSITTTTTTTLPRPHSLAITGGYLS